MAIRILTTGKRERRKKSKQLNDSKVKQEGDKMYWGAIVSLVLAFLEIFTQISIPVFGVLAMVFGIIALYKIRKQPSYYQGRTPAMAGIIIGTILTLVALILL
jgi:hypothetical protein